MFKHGRSSSSWLTLGNSVPIDFLGPALGGDSEDGVLGLRIELGGGNLPYICEAPSSIPSTGENAHGLRNDSSLFSKEQKVEGYVSLFLYLQWRKDLAINSKRHFSSTSGFLGSKASVRPAQEDSLHHTVV